MTDAIDAARTFSAKEREKLAKRGQALPDGSFPIVSKQDLKNAIQAYGRASNKAKAKRHIIKRAKALGETEMLPEDWSQLTGDGMDLAEQDEKRGWRKAPDSALLECIHEDCERSFATESAAEDHALAVHSHDEVRAALSKALRAKFAGPPRTWVYVEATADDWFVYEVEGSYGVDPRLFRQEYTFADGEATLTGEPVEVRRRLVYEPVATSA